MEQPAVTIDATNDGPLGGSMLFTTLMDNIRRAQLQEMEETTTDPASTGRSMRMFQNSNQRRENILNLLADLQRSLHDMSVYIKT